ncbi:MAG: hypothetical protein JWN14_3319 [Chthonomonadales bacterium]|nr:hypothetical protein [Chthonomonadales bacterium]
MRIMVTGATGFVGTPLCARLLQDGHSVVALTRNAERAQSVLGPEVRCLAWGGPNDTEWREAIGIVDTVVHLAGESVGAEHWTAAYKQKIYDSRILTTRALVEAIGRQTTRPSALLCASAVGYYGDRKDEILTEGSSPGTDFLARTCRDWEAEACKAEGLGLRVARMRIGVVLGRGGALEQMLYPLPLPVSPFKLGLGGPIGNGRQWFPWIHLEDVVGLFAWAATTEAVGGAFNVVAPNVVTNAEFVHAIGRILHRPTVAPVPGFLLKMMLGEFAEVLLGGQRALPTAAQAMGYRFRYENLEETLRALLPAIRK